MDYSRLKKFIHKTEVAMLTTAQSDGSFQSRPMITAGCSLASEYGKSELWFITGENTSKAEQVLEDPRISVTYCDPRKRISVSISGSCELVHDSVRLERLWRPELKTWFPAGFSTEDLALLRVVIDHVDVWEKNRHDQADLKPPKISGTRKAA